MDINNNIHMFCLNYVHFFKRIDLALKTFKDAWNHHPLSTEGNLSPHQLWIQGVATSGHAPEVDDVALQVYYTIHTLHHCT